jgi:transposase
LYLDRTGCAWRYLPADFPPWQTVYGYFARWRDDGTLHRLHDALRAQARTAAGRNAEPTAAVIDSQSVRAADTVPRASRGWDNAKKVNGRKRHIAVDTTGLLLAVVITAASVQDRDGARPLLWNLRRACTKILLVWADAGYATSKLAAWAAALTMTVQVVARRDRHVFEVLPRRWVVERTFAWISKHRRTVRDYEQLPASHEAMILWAMISLMTRRLAQPTELSDAHLALSISLTWSTARARVSNARTEPARTRPRACELACESGSPAVLSPWPTSAGPVVSVTARSWGNAGFTETAAGPLHRRYSGRYHPYRW